MKNQIIFDVLDLQLFAEAAASGDAGTSEATGETVADAAQQIGRKSNPLANVRYGKQDEEVEAADPQPQRAIDVSPDDRAAKFDALIKGEYKDLYDANVQNVIKKRLKGTKEAAEKYESLSSTIEILAHKYGVDADDIDSLNQAIEEDDSFYEQEALEKGISVKQLKEMRKLERENAELHRKMEEQYMKDAAEERYKKWLEDAETVATIYPQFNLQEELQNPSFCDLLQKGVDLKAAYEVANMDKLIPSAMQFATKKAEQKIANSILSGKRPQENGSSNHSTAIVKTDVSKLTKADRDEINRRVARGERITF